ncbi:MAG: GGDEF domain-containing protein, partial [Myxococcales bacterium]|nr:GGDEF domain-containing protein [Myxococcales bacterium]
NDRYGHDVGNQAIVAVARRLVEDLRGADFAARFGGDEFVVLLPHQTPREALALSERLLGALRSVRLGCAADERSSPPGLTVSIGIAGHWEDSPKSGAEELLHASDAALYEAKRRGRDQAVVYEDALEARGRVEYHA